MLDRLRRKFVAIVMLLVGAVLIAVLGTAYVSSRQAQQLYIERALQRSLDRGMGDVPTIGDPQLNDSSRQGGWYTLLVDVGTDGVILQRNNSIVSVNSDVLDSVIGKVMGGKTAGTDHNLHFAWASMLQADGVIRIALVDITTSDAVLRDQGIRSIYIVCIALVALYAISRWLANWALKPVEEAWEQQHRFVSDASHELKTPLAVILANTQILQQDETIGDDAQRWVESTADEATHMKALVGDLLQLARADESATEGGSNAMRRQDIDLSEMVESASLEFDAIAFERGCLLESIVEDGIHLQGDPEWMERLVRILIDNACKYAEPDTTIYVRLAQSDRHISFSVHNKGNPIDEEDLPHVFERFYRSDKARSRESEGGFGLGLAIAKSITEAHGGTISVTSDAASGTTFSVTI